MPNCVWCETRPIPNVSWQTWLDVGQRISFCDECAANFASLVRCRVCAGCGRDLDQLEAVFQQDGMCRDCEKWMTATEHGATRSSLFSKNRSVFAYNDFLKDVMTRFKFRGDALLIEGFRPPLQVAYKKWFKHHVAVPIPISETRRLERTFNQASLIAHCLPTKVTEALKRVDQVGKQSKKTREERLHSASLNPFQADFQLKKEIEGQAVVLIDDIYTTGATVHLAAKALEPLHPKSISSFTLARG